MGCLLLTLVFFCGIVFLFGLGKLFSHIVRLDKYFKDQEDDNKK